MSDGCMINGRFHLSKSISRVILFSLSIIALSFPISSYADDDGPALPLFKYVPQKLTDANRARVAQLFEDNCSVCHGQGGGQDNGLALYGSKNAQLNASAIHYGRVEPIPKTAYAEPVVMPAFGNQLTQVQIGELVAYIDTLRAPWPPK